MTPVKSEIADSPVYGMHPGMSARGTFAISSSNPAPEATMRWIDYLYSYEGATLFNQGPEGTLWKFKDEANRVKEWPQCQAVVIVRSIAAKSRRTTAF